MSWTERATSSARVISEDARKASQQAADVISELSRRAAEQAAIARRNLAKRAEDVTEKIQEKSSRSPRTTPTCRCGCGLFSLSQHWWYWC